MGSRRVLVMLSMWECCGTVSDTALLEIAMAWRDG